MVAKLTTTGEATNPMRHGPTPTARLNHQTVLPGTVSVGKGADCSVLLGLAGPQLSETTRASGCTGRD